MAEDLFGMTVVPSFLGHLGSEDPRELCILFQRLDYITHNFILEI